MARIRLVPTEELTPRLREIAKGAEAHKLNPRIFQAAGNLPEAYEAFWDFSNWKDCWRSGSRSWYG